MKPGIPARGGRTECKAPRFLSTLIAVATISALGAIGCGVPVLSHLDGRPFVVASNLTTMNGGWAAVDQCELGVHVLVEFEAPRTITRPEEWVRNDLVLLVGDEVLRPTEVGVEGPFCRTDTGSFMRSDGRNTGDGIAMGRPEGIGGQQCQEGYIVRAEFELASMPQPGDVLRISSWRGTIENKVFAIR